MSTEKHVTNEAAGHVVDPNLIDTAVPEALDRPTLVAGLSTTADVDDQSGQPTRPTGQDVGGTDAVRDATKRTLG